MPTALVVRHSPNPAPGLVGRHLVASGCTLRHHTVCSRLGDPTHDKPFPSLDDIDLLLLLGSRWSVYDTDAIGDWIADEFDLVRNADDRGIRTWGICFGAQVIAAAFGGSIEKSPSPEIGWQSVRSDHPAISAGPWFQWHGDRVVLPADATVLATSPQNVQAFTVSHAVGVQFHPEVDEQVIDAWLELELDRRDLVDGGGDVSALIEETKVRRDEVARRTAQLTGWAT